MGHHFLRSPFSSPEFLDYYATGKLNIDVATDVVSGIAEGCLQSGAALVGGETAEMPGTYSKGKFDIAGFSLGIVEKKKLLKNLSISSSISSLVFLFFLNE